MNRTLHPGSRDRLIAASALAAATLHAAAIWLAWRSGGTPVALPPTPLEVRFVADEAASAAASAPTSVPVALPRPQPERRLPNQPRPQAAPPPRPAAPLRAPAPAPVLTAETTRAAPEAPAIPAAKPPAPVTAPGPQAVAPVVTAPVATAPAPAAAPAPSGAPDGPTVTAPRFDAAYLANPPPVYPVLSRRMGEEGRVVLRVHVESDGRPSQVELREPSGFQRLDEAALRAVRGWRFVPARRGDEAVAAWVLVPINFTLKTS
jgi:protein TonB